MWYSSSNQGDAHFRVSLQNHVIPAGLYTTDKNPEIKEDGPRGRTLAQFQTGPDAVPLPTFTLFACSSGALLSDVAPLCVCVPGKIYNAPSNLKSKVWKRF